LSIREAQPQEQLEQLLALAEGLAMGLEERGEKSAAHVVRLLIKALNETLQKEPQPGMFL